MSEHSEFIPFTREVEYIKTKKEPCNDSIVQSVVSAFLERSRIGQIKYGTNLDRTDLTTLQWIQHAQEELMDGILYLEKLKQTFTP
jgi:hypothetical protein|uniref:Uncharacterized protein n=1 Tax=viral metagenome TaxID=1070528 RepID=A0A6C0D2U0_9ZZZZ